MLRVLNKCAFLFPLQTWAMCNIYRFLNDTDRQSQPIIAQAYYMARNLSDTMASHARKFCFDEVPTTGDAHWGGRMFAHQHRVVPGQRQYLQKADE